MATTETKTERLKRLNRERVARFRQRKRQQKYNETHHIEPESPEPYAEKLEPETEENGFNPFRDFIPFEPKPSSNKEKNPNEYCSLCGKHRFLCECSDDEKRENEA